jgi:hypothetical protein
MNGLCRGAVDPGGLTLPVPRQKWSHGRGEGLVSYFLISI